MNEELIEKWDKRHAQAQGPAQPATVLAENAHLLPAHGMSLDLACGRGGNALFLAQRGLCSHGWDLSPIAIEQLQVLARRQSLEVHGSVRDVSRAPPAPQTFDVIVVSHFLDRAIMPAIVNALRPDGLLFYQTFIREKVDDSGPGNPNFRLDVNELLNLFSPLRVLVYREEGVVGDTRLGFRNLAMYVGMKV